VEVVLTTKVPEAETDGSAARVVVGQADLTIDTIDTLGGFQQSVMVIRSLFPGDASAQVGLTNPALTNEKEFDLGQLRANTFNRTSKPGQDGGSIPCGQEVFRDIE
jgi:hypothetical protein